MKQGTTDIAERPRTRRRSTGDELLAQWANEPYNGPQYTIEELHERIRQAEANIAAGKVYTSEEVHQRMLAKFPWLK